MNTIAIAVEKTFDANDLWTAITGSGWEQSPWWRKVKYNKEAIADWTEQGDPTTFSVEVSVDNPKDMDKAITKTITFADVVEACKKVWATKLYHCGMRVDDRIDNYDSCAGDIIMQMAVLGEVVYG
jgi:hypothetical protein